MIVERCRYGQSYFPKNDETVKFFLWMNTFFKEENKSAEAHFQLIDFLVSKYTYKVIMCHRGLGKSAITKYSILRWLYLGKKPNFGEFDYILMIQDSVSMVESTFETLLSMIENSDLKDIFEIRKKRLGDDPTIYIWHKELKKMFYLKGRGSGQSLRGTNIANKRPNIVILDDIENEEKHSTPESRNRLKNWFNNVVVPAINPNKYEFIFIGTPIHEDSLLMNLVESDVWKAIVLPVMESFPPEDWEECQTSWMDRFSCDYVKSIYDQYKSQGKETGFYQEYMLEVTPKDDLLFDISKIRKYKYEELLKDPYQFTYFVSVDLAVSEKSYADYTSIAVIGTNTNGDWFLVDGYFGRIKPDETIERIFAFVKKWRPYCVVLEKVAFQLSMKTFIENEMMRRRTYFNLEMVSRSKNKLAVIKSFQPLVEMGKFWIPEDYLSKFTDELVGEMSRITNDKILAKHDDLIDSISQLTLFEMPIDMPQPEIDDGVGYNFESPYIF